MPQPEFIDDPEKAVLDTLTPLPVLPVSSKAVIQDAAVGLAAQSGKDERPEFALAKAKKDAAASNKPRRRVSGWVRFSLWFTTYRKFFIFVVTLNGVGLFLAALNIWTYPRRYTGAFVLGNLLFAILMRNELFGRLSYLFVNKAFAKWTPLWWRLGCTSVLQHLGGIHSGCASSGFAWLIFRVTLIFIDHKDNHDAVLIMGVITNLAVSISILSAFPWVRNTHHNVFERHHRFIGWLGLLSTWVFVVLGDSYDLDTHSWNPDGVRVIRQQDFWYAFGMTVFILIPWFTVREVKVDIEVPSPKVAILRFERGMQQGLISRVSRSSVMEYHAFGIISEGTHAKYHYLICGVQGDFTRSLVNDPPTHLWTRQLKFAGVSHTSTLYKRGIRVCTGTGLGAALSTCLQNPDWYLIWIGSDQEKTFGPTISGLIHKHIEPERMCLWDSRARGGRPDVMQLIKDAYKSWGAEVVFITSNWQGNKEIMEGCKAAGIPAMGTLWDF
ncbi:hypothetical protein BD309DRAFT_969522 [Dichomitus squalens]|uniref:Uncharacterized protein n=2 Tax=Dichomitus squalens TaxID=114155 RepID=A0A4V2K387_9APHY|nr:uncharacterized protein DICSQDRAFT_92012 [Dichomitus squalens LYAD-421 SS1]EJF57564.1 hypothetical protein DICSQDRAFT_92012 [Dichomitus squalens LYAD-421 SS1]TBU39523.1 hypothetical protein BD309DRAFT_969522 [Dichomitus squalens]TBU59619.1 hypothetical protein BD310DRAFT_924641 [Dichomitus squalens]